MFIKMLEVKIVCNFGLNEAYTVVNVNIVMCLLFLFFKVVVALILMEQTKACSQVYSRCFSFFYLKFF